MTKHFFKEKQLIVIGILINIIFLAFSINYYLNALQINGVRGSFPQPFSFYGIDTFMDYYNVNYHALTSNFYNQPFQSVYTYLFRSLSFLLTRGECTESTSSLNLRDCDGNFIKYFIFIYIINVYLLIKILDSCKYKYLWALLFLTSFPMLYAFERGNYVILTMLIINIILLVKNKNYFELWLMILPLTKLYFLINYLIFFIDSIKKFIIYTIIFLLVILLGCLIYKNNEFLVFLNLIKFSSKETNIFELLTATSLLPFVKYTSLGFLNLSLKALFLLLASRLYIYITYLIEKDINLNDYKFLMLLLLLLTLIIVESTGYYAIILLYPFFSYFMSKSYFDNFEKFLIILISIPYPIDLWKYEYIEDHKIQTSIQLQSILVPILLIILFLKLTAKMRSYEN